MSNVPLVTIKYGVLYDIFFPLWGREALYIAVRIFYFFSTLLNMFTMKMLPALTFLFLGYLKGSLKNLPIISDYWMLNLLCISLRKPFDSIFNSSSLLLRLLSHLSTFKTDPHAFSPLSTFAIHRTGKI